MSTKTYAFVRDYRAGVDINLNGVAEPNGKYWMVEYSGYWGFEGDPGPLHRESYPRIADAMKRYGQLVESYHGIVLGINRLKAFKKPWVRPIVSSMTEVPKDDEAGVFHAGFMFATMASQSARSRTKRPWISIVTWLGEGQNNRVDQAMIEPSSDAHPPGISESGVLHVPISEMPQKLNKMWGSVVEVYRLSL